MTPSQTKFVLAFFTLVFLGNTYLRAEPTLAAQTGTNDETECVILLHGLARTQSSMHPMQLGLEQQGFRVVNLKL